MQRRVVDVKRAINLAVDYIQAMDRELLPVHDLRLEETVINDHDNWLITLSTSDSSMPIPFRRLFKTIEIDGRSGEILAMRIRNPEIAA